MAAAANSDSDDDSDDSDSTEQIGRSYKSFLHTATTHLTFPTFAWVDGEAPEPVPKESPPAAEAVRWVCRGSSRATSSRLPHRPQPAMPALGTMVRRNLHPHA